MELNLESNWKERLDPRLLALRAEAVQGRNPTCAEETLFYLLTAAASRAPKNILEVGAGEGLTACALLSVCGARYTGIERDHARASRAREHLRAFGLEGRAELLEGDAKDVLPQLESGAYDFIFLDGPKVQYRNYLQELKRAMPCGGVLFSDDVLLFGWVRGEAPKKRHMLAEHLREYLAALEGDSDLETEILPLGEGLAVSVKRSEGAGRPKNPVIR